MFALNPIGDKDYPDLVIKIGKFGGLYGMLRIKPMLALYKPETLPAILLLWSNI